MAIGKYWILLLNLETPILDSSLAAFTNLTNATLFKRSLTDRHSAVGVQGGNSYKFALEEKTSIHIVITQTLAKGEIL